MNLEKMFEMQKELDNRIIREKGLEGQDLLPGLILALQVELAECANEWRGFKFWSNDQQPRTCIINKKGETSRDYYKNPLLEEYVDCLHFILSIGNLTKYSKNNDVNDLKRNTLEASGVKAFLELFKEITFFNEERKVSKNTIGLTRIMIYERIFWRFNELGIALGFTPEQIEQAYMDKNAVNHKRQQEGY
ncbi:dUTP diphosphatase [Bacillus pumilus]|uniref:dUTP diphosphatase n=1 Tax=Bacillus pumilus TaxID=1408 RepID=UPI0022825BAA|nr:dUTP diphosphatase [Bacillus pumilus]MCY9674648.1 dUTP diphosphatase [Bacillus pumilus]